MKIALVSTWQIPCGIASYTSKLAKELIKLGNEVVILSEHTKKTFGRSYSEPVNAPIPYWPLWHRSQEYSAPFGLSAVKKIEENFDIVHFQHEFGLFPRTDDLINFDFAITLHTVDPNRRLFSKWLSKLTHKPIVHTLEAAVSLPFDTTIIPHGVTRTTPLSRKGFLVPGFVSKSKGTLEIIQGYIRALDLGLKEELTIKGLCRDQTYENKIRELVAKNDVKINLELDYFTDAEMSDAIRSAKAVILGNEGGTGYSASGQMHDAVGACTPILAKNVPIYRSPEDSGVLYYESSEALARMMIGINRFGNYLSEKNKGKGMDWLEVAKKTLAYY